MLNEIVLNQVANLIKEEIKQEILKVLLKQYMKNLIEECGGNDSPVIRRIIAVRKIGM